MLRTHLAPILVACLALVLSGCERGSEQLDDVVDTDPIHALAEGSATDGRTGLELYAPDARSAVVDASIEQARYWGRAPEGEAELEALLASSDRSTPEGEQALYVALGEFLGRHMVFTETAMQPGLHDLEVDGDRATGYRIGHNPGGEFREPVEFVRVDGHWYFAGPH